MNVEKLKTLKPVLSCQKFKKCFYTYRYNKKLDALFAKSTRIE